MLISVNKATLAGCEPDEYERTYREAGDCMATQPGHIAQMLVRSESSPGDYFAVAVWQDLSSYTRLAGIQELVDIFERVVSLSRKAEAKPDRIKLEHHKTEIVYKGATAPAELGGVGSMVCLNRIKVVGCDTEWYEQVYRQGSDYMAAQPGHLRHKLVRSRMDPLMYFSVAEWESLQHYRKLDGLTQLEEIFDQVNDKIEIENHECVVVYENS